MRNQNIAETGAFIGGTYQVLDFIGEGGMGLVYKVGHASLDRVFALKILKSEQLSDVAWKRFRTEAQAIARLDHANIIKIFDMSQDDGRPFYTMEFLSGESLDERLQANGPLALEEALPIFQQICAGLAYAHERGIIHRDIKPGNIMLVKDGQERNNLVKIVDFGIAKLQDSDGNTMQGLTRPGEVFGSPLYMSPEQCSGEKLDLRSDIYATGITFFQALTGRPPLLGKSALETVALHQNQKAPRLADIVGPGIFSEKLEQIIARMLAKNPGDRYDSLQSVGRALSQVAKEGGIVFTPPVVRSGNAFNVIAARDEADTTGGADRPVTKTSNTINNGTSTTGTTNLKYKSWANTGTLLAVAALIVVAVLSITIPIMTSTPRTKKTASAARQPYVSTITSGATAQAFDDALLNPRDAERNTGPQFVQEVTPEVKLEIAAFFKRQKIKGSDKYKPYLIASNAVSETYQFPEKFAIGNIISIRREGPVAATCKGKVTHGKGQHKFRPNDVTCEFPQLMKLFGTNDIKYLTIDHAKVPASELLDNIEHLKGLGDIEFYNCNLTDKEVVRLDGFPHLINVLINTPQLSGDVIANCKFVRHSNALILIKPKNVSPILEKLHEHHTICTLGLDQATLSDDDYDLIGKMTWLGELRLKDTNIDNANFEKLSDLQHLSTIRLTNCEKLTPACILTLKKLKKLEIIELPPVLANRNTKHILSSALPKLRELR